MMTDKTAVEGQDKQIRTENDRPQRPERIPFNTPRMRLGVPRQLPGYFLYWVNDDRGALEQAQRGGYEFVEPSEVGMTDKASQVIVRVGQKDNGEALYAYLMKLRDEFREEDLALQREPIDRFEQQIRAGTLDQAPGDKRYNRISIT